MLMPRQGMVTVSRGLVGAQRPSSLRRERLTHHCLCLLTPSYAQPALQPPGLWLAISPSPVILTLVWWSQGRTRSWGWLPNMSPTSFHMLVSKRDWDTASRSWQSRGLWHPWRRASIAAWEQMESWLPVPWLVRFRSHWLWSSTCHRMEFQDEVAEYHQVKTSFCLHSLPKLKRVEILDSWHCIPGTHLDYLLTSLFLACFFVFLQ